MASKVEWQKGYSSVSLVRHGKSSFYECKCKFCGETFKGQPQRLKDHLLCETPHKGMGIRPCDHRLTGIEDARQELLAKLRKQDENKKQPPSQMQTGTTGASGSGSGSSAGALAGWLIQLSTPANEQANDALATCIAETGMSFNQVGPSHPCLPMPKGGRERERELI